MFVSCKQHYVYATGRHQKFLHEVVWRNSTSWHFTDILLNCKKTYCLYHKCVFRLRVSSLLNEAFSGFAVSLSCVFNQM